MDAKARTIRFDDAPERIRAGNCVARPGWLDLDHLVHRDRIEPERRTEAEIYCVELIDEHGTGGQSRLAHLIGWDHSTVSRKHNGQSRITESDARAIQRAVEMIGSKSD
jgi:hypothetical protein